MKLISMLVLCICASNVFATGQTPDYIAFEGETYALHYTNPLEDYFDKHPDKAPTSTSTADWRGYVATFGVTNRTLVLKEIEREVSSKKRDDGVMISTYKSIKEDLFPNAGDLPIEWFSEVIVLPRGELETDHGRTHSNYILIEFTNGRITETKRLNTEEYDKIRTRQFFAFQKTDEYKKVAEEIKKEDESMEFIDSVIRCHIFDGYTTRFLDETNTANRAKSQSFDIGVEEKPTTNLPPRGAEGSCGSESSNP